MTETYQITNEDTVVISWDGENRTIRTFSMGTKEPLYVGNSLNLAAQSLEITRSELDYSLMFDPVVEE